MFFYRNISENNKLTSAIFVSCDLCQVADVTFQFLMALTRMMQPIKSVTKAIIFLISTVETLSKTQIKVNIKITNKKIKKIRFEFATSIKLRKGKQTWFWSLTTSKIFFKFQNSIKNRKVLLEWVFNIFIIVYLNIE